MIKNIVNLIFLMILFVGLNAHAQQMSYQGRIVDTITNLGITGPVTFRVQVRTPPTAADNCIMYEEQINANLFNGVYVITLNSPAAVRTDGTGYTAAQIFSNKNTFGAFNLPAGNCNFGAPLVWAPGANDGRRVNIFFYDANTMAPGTWEPIPTQTLGYVPAAIESLNVGGFAVDQLLRVTGPGGSPFNVSPLNDTQYNELIATLTGNSSFYLDQNDPAVGFTGNLAGDVTGAQGSTFVARIRNIPVSATAPAAGQVLSLQGGVWTPTTDGGGTVTSVTSANNFISIANVSSTPVITLNVGTVANTVAAGNDPRITGAIQDGGVASGDLTGTYPGPTVATVGGRTAAEVNTSVGETIAATSNNTNSTIVKRDGSGNASFTTAQATNFSGRNFYFYDAGANSVQIRATNALATSYVLTLPTTVPVANTVLGTNASGDMSWVNPLAGAVTNVTASAPVVSSGGATPNISMARATGAADGYLASSDFTVFNNKQTNTLTSGMAWIGSAGNAATEQFLNISNIKSTVGVPGATNWFAGAACPSGQQLAYSAVTDQMTCTAYALTADQVTIALATVLSGDATMNASGDLTVNNGAINDAKISDVAWTKITSTPTSIAGYGITDAILTEAGGVDTMQAGTLAARPAFNAAGVPFRVYVAQDTGETYYSDGTQWIKVGSAVGLGGTVTNVTGSSPVSVVSSTTTPVVSITRADGTTDGYLASTDFTTFNNKLSPALTTGNILVGVGNVATSVTPSGDISAITGGVFTLADSGVAAGTFTKVTVDSKGRVTTGANLNSADVTAGLGYTPVNRAGDTMTGTLNLPADGLTVGTNQLAVANSGRVTIGAASGDASALLDVASTTLGFLMPRMTTAQRDAIVSPANGLQIYNTQTGSIDYWDGASWLTIASTTGTIVTLNGLGAQNQLFATGTAGTDFNISSVSATHTFNFPTASTANRGLLNSTDFTTFNNKLTSVLPTGNLFVGVGNVATSVVPSGDVTSVTGGVFTLADTGVVSGTYGSSSAVPSFTVDSKGRMIAAGSQPYDDATAVTKGIVQAGTGLGVASGTLSVLYGTTGATAAAGNDARLSDARVPTGSATGDLTGTYPAPTIANDAITTVKIDDLAVTNAKINDVEWVKVTSTPTTIAGYGITDAILTDAGGVDTMQANTLASRPAFNAAGVPFRVYVAHDTGETYYSDGTQWIKIGSAIGSGGTVTNVAGTSPLSVVSGTSTPIISITRSNATTDGYLASTDFSAFNSKIRSISVNEPLNIDVTSPIDPVIGIDQATTTTHGFLTSGDFTTFNNKLTSVLPTGQVFVGVGNVATAVAVSGDLASAAGGVFVLADSGVAAGTYTKVTVDSKGRAIAGTSLNSTDVTSGLGYFPVDRAGDTMTGALNLPANGLTVGTNQLAVANSGRVSIGSASGDASALLDVTSTSMGFLMPRMTTAQRDAIGTPANGLQVYNTQTDTVDYWNGAAWLTLASTVGSISNLNGLTAPAQNFAVGSAGTDFAISSVSATHTFNIPTADATNNRGLLTSSDFTTFNNKLTSVLTTGNLFVGVGNVATSVVPSGDISSVTGGVFSLSNTGVAAGNYSSVTVDTKGRVTAGAVSQDLSFVTGTLAVPNGGTGANTLTSGSLVVGNGTGAVNFLAAGTAGNIIYGSGASAWSSGTPDTAGLVDKSTAQLISGDKSFKASVTINEAKSLRFGDADTTNFVSLRAPTVVSSDVTFTLPAADGNANQVLQTNGSGVLGWANALTDTLTTGSIYVGVGNVATGVAPSGDISSVTGGVFTLANSGVTSGTYTKVTVDAKGRVITGLNLNSSDVTTGLGYVPMESVSADDPMSVDNTDPRNPVISIGQATTTTHGFLTSGDFTTFNNKLTSVLTTGNLFVGVGNVATSVAPSGDISSVTGGVFSLSNTGVAAGNYSSVTVDAKGRVTAGAVSQDLSFVTGTLGVANGGTGANSITSGSIVIGGGTGAVTSLAAGTAGNIVYGSGASAWSSGTPDTAGLVDKSTAQLISGDKSFKASVTINEAKSLRFADADTTNFVSLRAPTAVSSDVTFTLPSNAGDANQVLQTNGSGTLSWADILTTTLTTGNIYVGVGNVATSVVPSGDISSVTGGVFTLANSGVTSGTYTKVTVDSKGRVITGLNLNSSDVTTGLGYVPMQSVTADAPMSVDNTDPRNPVISIGQATTTTHGFLTSGDFTTFNNKLTSVLTTGNLFVGVGNVATSVAPSGDISSVTGGVFELSNTGVAAGNYSSVTVDAKGRVTAGAVSQDLSFVTGTLGVANGGTGANTLTSGSLVVGNGTGAVNFLAAGTAGNIIYGSGASAWSSGTPDTAGLVDKSTAQLISGDKSFKASVTINEAKSLRFADADTTNFVSLRAPTAVSSDITFTLPSNAGDANQVLQTNGSGTLSWADILTTTLTTGNIYVGVGNVATSVVPSGDISSVTGGVFTLANSGVTSGTYTKVTVDSKGRVVTGLNLNSSDVTTGLGYVPMQSVSADAPMSVDNTDPRNPVISIGQATTTTHGFLTSGDFTTFNNKLTSVLTTGNLFVGVGNVATSVAPSGDISSVTGGVFSLSNTGVTAGNYSSVTVDAKGRVSAGAVSQDLSFVTGTLGVSNGGTGANSITSGSIVIGGGTGAVTSLAGASAGNVVYATGASAWSSGTPDTAGLVDKASGQTISGAKAFSNNLQMTAQNAVRFSDSDSSNYIGIRAPAVISSDVTFTLPAGNGNSNQVLQTDGAGTLSWADVLTGTLTTGNIYVGVGNVATSVTPSGDISSVTGGVFTLANSGVTSGTYTKVTVDSKGRVITGLNLNSSDVTTGLGYVPMQSVSADAPMSVDNTDPRNPVISIGQATTTTHGFLTSGDFTTFNNKLTSVLTTGNLFVGVGNVATSVVPSGDISSVTGGVFSLSNTGVAAGNYSSVTVDAKGRVTAGAVSQDLSFVTGTLPVANGGTGANTLTSGSLVVGNGTGAVNFLAAGTAGNIIYGSGASAWSSGTPDAAGLVDKTTAQLISGDKTFKAAVTINEQKALRLADADTSNYISIRAPAVVSSDVTFTLPAGNGNSNQVLQTDGSGTLSWADVLTGTLTTGNIYVGVGNVATSVTPSGDISSVTGGVFALSNTGVASGTYTKVSVDAKGRVTGSGSLNSSDVTTGLGYVPMQSVSADAPMSVDNTDPRNPVISIGQATTTTHGFLTSGDFTTFNNKLTSVLTTGNLFVGVGNVATSVAPSGDISSVTGGVFELSNTGVAAGNYSSVTVDAKGRVTAGAISQDLSFVTGTLPVANGGTGANTLTSGSLVVGNGTGAVNFLAAGTAGNIIYGSGASAWSSGTPDAAGLVDKTTAQLISGDKTFKAAVTINEQKALRLADADTSNYISIRAPAVVSSDVTFTLPAGNGNSNQVLQTDGSGTLSWADVLTGTLTTGNIYVGVGNVATSVTPSGDISSITGGVFALSNTGVASGTYTKVSVDAKGRVTGSGTLNSGDVTTGLGYVPLQGISADAPMSVDNTDPRNPVISIGQATTTTHGFLTSGDFTTFNNKLTSVLTTGNLFVGVGNVATSVVPSGDISSVTGGVFSLSNTGVAAGNYSSVTVDAKGRVTAGAASQDLSFVTGTLPVANGGTGANTLTSGSLVVGNGTGAVNFLTAGTAGNIIYGSGAAAWSSGTPDTAGLVDKSTAQLISGDKTFKAAVTINEQKALRLADADTSNYISIRAPAVVSSDVTFTLPAGNGNSNQVLQTDGSGTLSWADVLTGTLTTGNIYVGVGNVATSVTPSGDISSITGGVFALSNTGVTSGTYTKLSVDAKGRVTGAGSITSGDITGVLGYVPLQGVTADAPMSVDTTDPKNPVLSIGQATTTTHGFLTSGDFTTFNNKLTSVLTTGNIFVGVGNVATSVVPSGDISSVTGGVFALSNTGVASGTYTKVSVDAKGRVTGSGTLVSNDITTALGFVPMTNSLADANIFIGNAGGVATATTISGDATLSNGGNLSLTATGVTSGTGYSKFNVDAKGRVTSASVLASTDITSILGFTPMPNTLATNSIFVGVGNVATAVVPSGDISSAANGVFALSNTGVGAGTYSSVTVDAKGRVTAGAVSQDLSFVTGTLGVANGGTGATSIGSGNIVIGGGTGAVTSLAAGTAGNVVYATGASTWASGSADTAGLIDKTSTQLISGDKAFKASVTINEQKALRLADADNSNYISIRAPAAVSSDVTFTLPDGNGSANQVLQTNGSGTLSWADVLTATLTTGNIYVGVGNVATSVTPSGDISSVTGGVFELSTTGVASGTYTKLSVDTKGRVTGAGSITSGDITGVLGYVPLQGVTADAPMSVDTTDPKNPVLSIGQATTTTHGFLTSGDFTTFNNKLTSVLTTGNIFVGVGNVATSVVPSGDISSVTGGVFALSNTGVASGTYTKVSVDAKGRVTGSGSLVSNDITTALGFVPMTNSLADANVFIGNGSGVATATTISGDATLSNGGNLSLTATGVASGTYTKVSVDAKGRVTGSGTLISNDITTALGFTPMTNTLATNSIFVGVGNVATAVVPSGDISSAANGVFALSNTGVASGTYTKVSVDAKGRVTGSSSLVSNDITAALGFNPITDALASANIFIGNGSGVATATTISGDATLSNGGNLSLTATGVTSGTGYSKFDVDAKGRVTSASNLTSGDLTTILGYTPATNALASANIFIGNGSGVATATTISGDATLSNGGNLSLTTTGVASGTYTKVSVDAKGRVTGASSLNSTDITTALGGTLGVANGGTGLTGGTSGGIPFFSAAGTMGSTAALTANGVVLGGGAGTAPTATAAGGASTVFRVPAGGGAPSFGSIDLSVNTNVTGTLPVANGGTGVTTAAANTFFMGPSSGAAAAPSFRTITSSDISGSAYVLNGNSFGATATIGTNDLFNFVIETNNVPRITVAASGDVNVGTAGGALGAAPTTPTKLQVNGQAFSRVQTSTTDVTLSWDANNGNVMVWTPAATATTANITNLEPGGTYMLVIKNAGTNSVGISCNGNPTASTAFIPANGSRVNGTLNKTVYTLMWDGTDCMVTWITGY